MGEIYDIKTGKVMHIAEDILLPPHPLTVGSYSSGEYVYDYKEFVHEEPKTNLFPYWEYPYESTSNLGIWSGDEPEGGE